MGASPPVCGFSTKFLNFLLEFDGPRRIHFFYPLHKEIIKARKGYPAVIGAGRPHRHDRAALPFVPQGKKAAALQFSPEHNHGGGHRVARRLWYFNRRLTLRNASSFLSQGFFSK